MLAYYPCQYNFSSMSLLTPRTRSFYVFDYVTHLFWKMGFCGKNNKSYRSLSIRGGLCTTEKRSHSIRKNMTNSKFFTWRKIILCVDTHHHVIYLFSPITNLLVDDNFHLSIFNFYSLLTGPVLSVRLFYQLRASWDYSWLRLIRHYG